MREDGTETLKFDLRKVVGERVRDFGKHFGGEAAEFGEILAKWTGEVDESDVFDWAAI